MADPSEGADGSLFVPNNMNRGNAHAAIIVGHRMGAVKEQSANLYATKLAEQGFVTLSIDLPYWGESEGRPRNVVAPALYAEAFSAAVDYLGTQRFVDRERIGVVGVCASGSFAVSAAKIDPRMPGAGHVDLYDRVSLIPWAKLTAFFRQHLAQQATPAAA